MIENLPTWIEGLFIVAWLGTILLFHFSHGKPRLITLGVVAWSALHAALAWTGFYENADAVPPRFGFILLPIALIVVLGSLPKPMAWVKENRHPALSTLLHTVRIPVEIVLWQLFVYGWVPELMTFEGRNFDILAGLSAPIIAILIYRKSIQPTWRLAWNIISLGLVLFIMVNGILSAELPFQQFAFDQPNRGIAYFPFVLLPAVIVPMVVWTHITDILLLRKQLKRT